MLAPPPPTADAGTPSDDGGVPPGGNGPDDAGYVANPSGGIWADALAPIAQPWPYSGGGDPSLLIEPGGAVDLAVHRMIVAACLICTAERLVRQWDGSQWQVLADDSGRPGSGSLPTALAWDRARQRLLVADNDLSDPYHPPVPTRVYAVADHAFQQIAGPFGASEQTSAQSLAVDAAGNVTVAWLDGFALHLTRVDAASSVATDLPAPDGSSASLQVDAAGRVVAGWCGQSGAGVDVWDPGRGAWSRAQVPADVAGEPGSVCGVSLALDASGRALLAWWSGVRANADVSVARWDGTSWVSFGHLGTGPAFLVFTTRGTPMLATRGGIQELTDRWRVVDPAPAGDTWPAGLAAADGRVVAVWSRAPATQPGSWLFRELRW